MRNIHKRRDEYVERLNKVTGVALTKRHTPAVSGETVVESDSGMESETCFHEACEVIEQ